MGVFWRDERWIASGAERSLSGEKMLYGESIYRSLFYKRVFRVSLEPALPFEFLVLGTAISSQSSSRSKDSWKECVRNSARDALSTGSWLLTEAVAVTIFLFPRAAMKGDIDNCVKPILDAMTKCVYVDDVQVGRLVVQKFEPGGIFAFESPSSTLANALSVDGPSVYVRVTDNLHEELC